MAAVLTHCDVIMALAELWFAEPGDGVMMNEIINHRQECPECLAVAEAIREQKEPAHIEEEV